MNKKICVIGLGYIGLPTSVVFAENDWNVIGVDINRLAVEKLNKGEVHIKEKGLDSVLNNVVKAGKFFASLIPEKADVFIVSVSTPHNEDNTANLENVQNAVKAILSVLEKGNTIILESTVPPRTTRDVVAPILKNAGFNPGEDVYLAYCPERVLPGNILVELVENNRIIGGINKVSAKKAADIYRTFVKGKVIETTAESAEMSKLMENTYRDVNIALANELAKISENLNIDPLEVIRLANEHPRVNIHQPGPGVGGHCIAVDPYFIIEKDQENTNLIRSARTINESMPSFVVKQVKKLVKEPEKIAVFGLAFKGNVDDVRNSPSIEIINLLKTEGYHVHAYDPYVKQEQVICGLSSFDESLRDAKLMIILTDHDEFKSMDWNNICDLMDDPVVLDTKSCISVNHKDVKYIDYSNLHTVKNDLFVQING